MTPIRRPRPDTLAPRVSLPPKHARFVREYLVDLNATQAALRAGYSPRTADAQGSRLLTKVEIARAVELASEKRAQRTEITADRVLQELALLAFSSIEHYTVDDAGQVMVKEDAPPGAIRAIASVKHTIRTSHDGEVIRDVEFRLWDKPGPLKLAGQHVGRFAKKVEVSGPNGGPIEVARSQVQQLSGLSDQELAAVERASLMLTDGAS